jgi:hypothetical protein
MRGLAGGDAGLGSRVVATAVGGLLLAATACAPGQDTLASKANGGHDPAAAGNSGTAPAASGGSRGGAAGGEAGSQGASAVCIVPGCGMGGELPSGTNLGGVWIGPANDVWAVGGAFVGHRPANTAQWCWCAPNGPLDLLTDVWGAAGDDIFAVGNVVLRFDGTRWVPDDPLPVGINGVHGSGPDNVWIAGPAGWTARFDGSTWQSAMIDPKYNLNAVWVDPTGVVRVAGTAPIPPGEEIGTSPTSEAVVLRHPGAATGDWTQEASFPQKGSASFFAISGSSPTDIWAVGENLPSGAAQGPIGFVTHFDGTAWSRVQPDPIDLWEFVNVVDVAVATPDAGAVWFLDVREGARFDGTTWTTNPALANTGAIDARDGVMYAVGDAGLIVRWTAQTGWIVDRPARP